MIHGFLRIALTFLLCVSVVLACSFIFLLRLFILSFLLVCPSHVFHVCPSTFAFEIQNLLVLFLCIVV